MHDNYFDPVGLHIDPGTTVRFEVEAGSHSATAYEDRIPAEASPFDSDVISDGGFEQTFDTPGTYDYYCIPHRSAGMVGRIVVGEPGGPAEADGIPDGAVPESETIVEQGTVGSGEFDGSDRAAGGGMMSGGPGMMHGGDPGWMLLVPVGFFTAILGVVGGVVYWASGRRTTRKTADDSAMALLRERYARGDIDENEYAERQRRLQQEGQHDDY